jgi:hypothetical protein
MVSQVEAAVNAADRYTQSELSNLRRTVRGSLGALISATNQVLSIVHSIDAHVADAQEVDGERGSPARAVPLVSRVRQLSAGATVQPAAAPKRDPAPAREKKPSADGALPPTQQKILDAMAELRQLGVDEPSRTQIGMWASRNIVGGGGGHCSPRDSDDTPRRSRASTLLEEAKAIEAAGGDWAVRHVCAVLGCHRATLYRTPWLMARMIHGPGRA